MSNSRVKIVSESNSSRAAASRIYLDDKDITESVKDIHLYIDKDTGRWALNIKFTAEVDIDVSSEVKATVPVNSSHLCNGKDSLNAGVPIPCVDAYSTKTIPIPEI